MLRASFTADRSLRESGVWIAVFLSAAVISAFYAYYSIFSKFALYDDEGFVLISLKFFFEGHALYDEVYSCYQPFFSLFNRIAFNLWGAPLCHDSIRLLTIATWLSGAAVTSYAAYRLSFSRLAALIVFVASVQYLSPLSNEPGHPQSLSYLLVASVVATIACLKNLPRIVFPLMLGALVGMLLLTKINIGIYTMIGVGLMLFAGSSGMLAVQVQRAIGAIMVLLPLALVYPFLTAASFWSSHLVFVPLCLMVALLSAAFMTYPKVWWGMITGAGLISLCFTELKSASSYELYFGLIVGFSALFAVIGSQLGRPSVGLDYRDRLFTAAGSGVVVFIILAVTLISGTSFHGLAEGLFLIPAGLAKSFVMLPKEVDPRMALSPLAGVVCFYLYIHLRYRNSDSRWLDRFLTTARIAFAFLVLWKLNHLWPPVLLPFAWLLLTNEDVSPKEYLARTGILAVTVMQSLIAFPISGSQHAPASVLMILIAAVCMMDAVRTLQPLIVNLPRYRLFRLSIIVIVVLSFMFPLGRKAVKSGRNYALLTPLELPGAARVRLPVNQVRTFKKLVKGLAGPEVDTFLTLPGLCSLYFWARKDPPTGLNVSYWMGLLDDQAQGRIWEAANRHPGLLAVRNVSLARYWLQGGPGQLSMDDIPLARNIDFHLKTILKINGYEIMDRR